MTSPRLVTIDCDYVLPQVACAYLRIQGDEAAFIETNTTYAVPKLLATLEAEGMKPEQVRYVIITHVHLDHAGGTSALLAACPNATVLAHPRAARHLIDPEKLVASARAVYGEAKFDALYGKIDPIPEARVEALDDGAVRSLGGRSLLFDYALGHAKHHFTVFDPSRDTVYSGDSFGLVYPRLQRRGLLAYPSTSPTDFDGPAALATVDRLMGLGTKSVCLTHFGEVGRPAEIAAQLRRWLELSISLVEKHASTPKDQTEQAIRAELEKAMNAELERLGLEPDDVDRGLIAFDLDLNAQGLAFAAHRSKS
jgi:glyoxylase-like metal-dependent hydrolase (beta-lactamase superfamily II)